MTSEATQSGMSVSSTGTMAAMVRVIYVVDKDIVDLWTTVQSSLNLDTDNDTARFLLSLYFSDTKGMQHCPTCHSTLQPTCLTCLQSSPSPPPLPVPATHTPAVQTTPQSTQTSLWTKDPSSSPLSIHVYSQSSVGSAKEANSIPTTLVNNYSDDESQSTLLLDVFDDDSLPDSDHGKESQFSAYDCKEIKPPANVDKESKPPAYVDKESKPASFVGKGCLTRGRSQTRKIVQRGESPSTVNVNQLTKAAKVPVVVLNRCDHDTVQKPRRGRKRKSAFDAVPKTSRKDELKSAGIKTLSEDKETLESSNVLDDEEAAPNTDSRQIVKVRRQGHGYKDRFQCSQCDRLFFRMSEAMVHLQTPCSSVDAASVSSSGTDLVDYRASNKKGKQTEIIHSESQGGGDTSKSTNLKTIPAPLSKNHPKRYLYHTVALGRCTLEQFMTGQHPLVLVIRPKRIQTHYPCRACGRVLETLPEIDYHRRNPELVDCLKPGEGPRPLDAKSLEILQRVKEQHCSVCPHCTRVFYNKKKIIFEDHVRSHFTADGTFIPDVVQQRLEEMEGEPQSGLHIVYGKRRNNWRSRNKYADDYSCSECGRTFKQKTHILEHMSLERCDDPVPSHPRKVSVPDLEDLPRPKRKSAQKVTFTSSQSDDDDDEVEEKEEKVEDMEAKWITEEDMKHDRRKKLYQKMMRSKQRNLIRHQQTVHTLQEFMEGRYNILLRRDKRGSRPYTHHACLKCYTVVETIAEYTQHKRKYCAAVRGEPFERRFDERSLEILNRVKEEYLHLCPCCDRVFSHKGAFREHLTSHRSDDFGEQTWSCGLCSAAFPNYEDLYQHLTMQGSKDKCRVCDWEFKAACQIQPHMATHPKEELLVQCNRCQQSFPPEQMPRHRATHRSATKSCLCPECGKTMSSASALRDHLQYTHSSERPHACSQCPKTFKHHLTLKHHEATHGEKTVACNLCPEMFHSNHARQRHVYVKHAPTKIFTCHICGAKKSNKTFLKTHLKIHVKAIACKLCGVRFTNNSSLNEHMRSHTGEKPYKCSQCSSAFGRRDYLRKHQRIHTGEKPFQCEDCGEKFTLTAGLRQHRKKKHRSKAFICPICSQIVHTRNGFKYHLQLKHPKEYTPAFALQTGAKVAKAESSGVNVSVMSEGEACQRAVENMQVEYHSMLPTELANSSLGPPAFVLDPSIVTEQRHHAHFL